MNVLIGTNAQPLPGRFLCRGYESWTSWDFREEVRIDHTFAPVPVERDLHVLRATATRAGIDLLTRARVAWWPDPEMWPLHCSNTYSRHGAIGSIEDVRNRFLGLGEGTGTAVAVIDGGVDPTLVHVIADVPNMASAQFGSHGSMLAFNIGTIAPATTIIDVNIAAPSSGATVPVWISNFCAALEWLIEYRTRTQQPLIACCAWGLFDPKPYLAYATAPWNHPVYPILKRAIAAGVIVMFGAGNCGGCYGGTGCNGFLGPGNSIWGANSLEEVITIGGCTLPDPRSGMCKVLGESSPGPTWDLRQKPDFCAFSHFEGYGTFVNGGSSTACATAAGLCALLLAQNPEWNQEDLRSNLIAMAQHVTGTPVGQWDPADGYGLLQP